MASGVSHSDQMSEVYTQHGLSHIRWFCYTHTPKPYSQPGHDTTVTGSARTALRGFQTSDNVRMPVRCAYHWTAYRRSADFCHTGNCTASWSRSSRTPMILWHRQTQHTFSDTKKLCYYLFAIYYLLGHPQVTHVKFR